MKRLLHLVLTMLAAPTRVNAIDSALTYFDVIHSQLIAIASQTLAGYDAIDVKLGTGVCTKFRKEMPDAFVSGDKTRI